MADETVFDTPHAEAWPHDPLRPADEVMRLERMGAAHQTRISFMRTLIRRMAHETWRIACQRFDIGADETGEAVYTIETPAGLYSFVVFAAEIDPENRTDRVIAEQWDYTFTLVEGEPTAGEMAHLRVQVPKQENARMSARHLVLSRANKSGRLFGHVVDALAEGRVRFFRDAARARLAGDLRDAGHLDDRRPLDEGERIVALDRALTRAGGGDVAPATLITWLEGGRPRGGDGAEPVRGDGALAADDDAPTESS
jgi:hypothetical protein